MALFWKKTPAKKSRENSTNVDMELIEIVDIAVKKIGPRYPGEIFIFIANHNTKIDFEEFDESYSDVFRAVIKKAAISSQLDYNWALNYFGITENDAATLRRLGQFSNGSWSILSDRNVSLSTISQVHTIIQNHNAQVTIVGDCNDRTKVSVRCKPI